MHSTRRVTLAAIFLLASACAAPFPIQADPVKIVPHRAIYELSLGRTSQNSEVSAASGKMFFEWGGDCSGWIVKQQELLTFFKPEGDPINIRINMTSWESKDGKTYDFNVDRLTTGKPEEHFRGQADLAASGSGIAHYAEPPNTKDVPLTLGTLFPSAHSIALIERAKAGDKILSRTIFDGSDEDGKSDATAFIGKAQQLDGVDGVNSPLTHGTMWPIRIAFFPADKSADQPDYEMTMNLMENGVAESMVMDYGDFALNAKLKAIEPLPPPKCGS